jgi:TPR repeat protein
MGSNFEIEESLCPYRNKFSTEEITKGKLRYYDLTNACSPEEKFKILRESSAFGYPKAQTKLALLIFKSEPQTARELLLMSAAQNYPDAFFQLGRVYETLFNSFQVEQNLELARFLVQKAAELQHSKAQYYLASSHIDGSYNTPINFHQGWQELTTLAAQGNKYAQKHIKNYDEQAK